ncbi:MAG: hypothetical protein Q4D98_09850 [Planctomycetia bacterium]|nr:hypothetical protein [Planctomycetia bacterium]
MKTLGKILILLIAWCLLTGLTYPVSQTPWADSVRVMVREARAKRKAKMETAALQHGRHEPQAGRASHGDAKPEPRKGPRAKAPNLSLGSLAEIRIFLMFSLIPCVLTILLRKALRRKIA